MKKIILIVCFLMFIPQSVSARPLGRMATQAQLEKYCIPLRLKLDGDIHWIFYKHIKSFNEEGVTIKFGRRLDKSYRIAKAEIINFEEAKDKYFKLIMANP